MGRPRKYATNAEKQAAYRSRKKTPAEKIAKAVEARVDAQKTRAGKPVSFSNPTRPPSCSAFTPRGTKCKFCGKTHA